MLSSSQVTLAINAHREGVILHKTLNSVEALVSSCKEKGISVEVILVADLPDAETLRVIQSFASLISKLAIVEFGDLSESRNHAASLAGSEYLTFLDGDDFYSRNWISECLAEAARRNNDLSDFVLRPEFVISFDRVHDYWKQLGEDHPAFDYSCFIENNPWASISFGRTETYRKFPYLSLRGPAGFGYEDWHWHAQLVANGVRNYTVSETCYFYRKKHVGSLAQAKLGQVAAIPASKLFDETELLLRHGHEAKPRVWRALARAEFPTWLKEEMSVASSFEYGLYPSQSLLNNYKPYLVPGSELAAPYAAAYELMSDKNWDYVFFVPWLKRGGADLGTLHHINALVKQNKNICLITTEDADSPWLTKLDQSVRTVELGRLCSGLSRHEVNNVALRLMIQLKPARIHNINSWACWDLFRDHSKKLKLNTHLFASLYCEDRSRLEDIPGGYAVTHLEQTWRDLDAIFSDNATWPKRWQQMYGIPQEKFVTAYFPTADVTSEETGSTEAKNILWASRLDTQKQPEILEIISALLPKVNFHVYGEALLDAEMIVLKRLKARSNIHLHGKFDGLKSTLNHGPYAAFLYTSKWDGIPNILLEAIALRIPLVSTIVGGIPELLNDQNAFIVAQEDSPTEFLERLLEAIGDPELCRIKCTQATADMRAQHNVPSFETALKSAPGYI